MCLHYKLGSIPKAPFSPTSPSSLLPLFWLLPEWELPGPRKTHFLPSGRFPASYFILHFPTWMKSKPMVVPAFQHSINTPLPHREQLEWSLWADQAQWNTRSVFWFLLQSAGSSSLLPVVPSQTARRHQTDFAVGPQPLTTHQNVAADIFCISRYKRY